MMTMQERQERAAERAAAEFPRARVCDLPGGGWRVFGRRNDAYTVRRGEYVTCDCPAGLTGAPCWHAELVRLLWSLAPDPAPAPELELAPVRQHSAAYRALFDD